MSLPFLLEPENARVTIPLVLAMGYALYHWWRWRRLHPRIDVENLPAPAATPRTVEKEQVAAPASEPTPAAATPEVAKPADTPRPRRGVLRMYGQYKGPTSAAEEEQLELEAGDPYCHAKAFRRANGWQPEFFVRLGEYAWRRGAMVEAHYWVTMGKCRGVQGLDAWLGRIRDVWVRNGRPMEEENIYAEFPFETAQLARALMAVSTGIGAPSGLAFLTAQADGGDPNAQLLLEVCH